jgi:hypothetical protein
MLGAPGLASFLWSGAFLLSCPSAMVVASRVVSQIALGLRQIIIDFLHVNGGSGAPFPHPT